MGFLFFLALGFLIYSNSRLATAKGQNPVAWGLISVAAFFASYIVLASIYLGFVYKGPMTQEGMQAFVEGNPFAGLLLVLLGFSGILGVRFYLERSQFRKSRRD